MDIKNIKKIIELMKENDLSEFELSEEGFRITIRRPYDTAAPQVIMSQPTAAMPVPTAAAPAPQAAAAAGAPAPAEEAAGSNLLEITSPMVGTFYRSPSPEQDSYVSPGSEVDEEDVVCIIEAMKVMNEIKAEVKGVVRKVLVDNATPVEFGQPLFLVEPQ